MISLAAPNVAGLTSATITLGWSRLSRLPAGQPCVEWSNEVDRSLMPEVPPGEGADFYLFGFPFALAADGLCFVNTGWRCSMNNWNQLLAVLDKTIGFPNRIDSTVKKVRQGYDEKKNEHVIYLEYRVRVKPGGMNVPNPDALRLLRDLVGSGGS